MPRTHNALRNICGRVDAGKDLLVTAEPYTRMTVAAVEHLFESQSTAIVRDLPTNTLLAGGLRASSTVHVRPPPQVPLLGVRYFVPSQLGTGYWDNFRPLSHVVLTIADVTYREPAWIDVHGEGLFKLRFLLSGQLLDAPRRALLEGPAAVLAQHPRGTEDSGYYLAGQRETRVVILNCHPEVLTETFGLEEAEIPAILQPLCNGQASGSGIRRLTLTPKALEAAMDIVQSRYEYSGTLRASFLEAKCREILCAVLNDLQLADIGHRTGTRLAARDVNRVLEARDYLAHQFRQPPSIAMLARRIGVSQTRLKANFRQVLGTTLHAYAQELRMRTASAMLLQGDQTIAEIAYSVGYDHPANFTSAFRKFYGFLPRALKPRRREP